MAGRMVDLFIEAQAMGFTLEYCGKHIRATRTNPDAVVILSKTASDGRSLRNMRADLRRASNPNHPYGKRVKHGQASR
jgi:hypothetical protein